MRFPVIAVAVCVLSLASCGGSGQASSQEPVVSTTAPETTTTTTAATTTAPQTTTTTTPETTTTTTAPQTTTTTTPETTTTTADTFELTPDAASGGDVGTATLVLDNGDRFDFEIKCALQPTDVGDGNIVLFGAVSLDSPYQMTATKYTEDSAASGRASITVWENDMTDKVWQAANVVEELLSLELDGSIIHGQGIFALGGIDEDISQVNNGVFEARC